MVDLDHAIKLYHDILDTPPETFSEVLIHEKLSISFRLKLEKTNSASALEEWIRFSEKTVSQGADDSLGHKYLCDYANALRRKFEMFGSWECLNKSIQHYISALNHANATNEWTWYFETTNSLGGAYIYSGEYEIAENLFQGFICSLQASEEAWNICSKDVWLILNNIGATLLQQNHIDIALSYFESALEELKEESTSASALILINIGDAYCRIGHQKETMKYFRDALDVLQSTDELSELVAVSDLCHSNFPEFQKDPAVFSKSFSTRFPPTKDIVRVGPVSWFRAVPRAVPLRFEEAEKNSKLDSRSALLERGSDVYPLLLPSV
jgi:tetratricopeptide (TPR) repeat protein